MFLQIPRLPLQCVTLSVNSIGAIGQFTVPAERLTSRGFEFNSESHDEGPGAIH